MGKPTGSSRRHAKQCPVCTGTFQPVRSDAVYCSRRCSYRARTALRTGQPLRQPLCEGCGASLAGRHGNARFCRQCVEGRPATWEKTREERHGRDRACAGCGTTFHAKTGRERYCSARCSGIRARKDQLDRAWVVSCPVCGKECQTADTRWIACSTSCRQYFKAHPEHRDEPRSCELCSVDISATPRNTRFCSRSCRNASGKRRLGKVSRPFARYDTCQYCGNPMEDRKAGAKYCSERCSDWACSDNGPYSARVGRRCPHCGKEIPVEARINRRFCSESCAVKSNQALRRFRKVGLPAEVVDRIEIFERDEWTCHLCTHTVNPDLPGRHPFAPSLDHIISLAHLDSPGHVWENVALAHLRCNTSKNARVTRHDWALYRELLAQRSKEEQWRPKRPALPQPQQLVVF